MKGTLEKLAHYSKLGYPVNIAQRTPKAPGVDPNAEDDPKCQRCHRKFPIAKSFGRHFEDEKRVQKRS